jgi:hypothetical protein
MSILDQLVQQVEVTREQIAGLSRSELAIVGMAIIVAAYSFLHLFVIDRREALYDRIAQLRGVVGRPRGTISSTPLDGDKDAGNAFLQRWGRRIGGVLASSAIVGGKERERLGQVLADAGLRGRDRVATLLAAKLVRLVRGGCPIWSWAGWRPNAGIASRKGCRTLSTFW